MSITHISPVYDLGQRADYLQHGVGAKRREHRARGTDRIAPGFHCDAESIDAFIAQGNALASSHGRRVKAHSIIVSFSAEELSVRSAADLQLVGDMGLELARRAFPNSPSMVVVHDDAKGGNPHAHVTVLNHDLTTGKAPVKNRTHAQIARLNDQLMKESGLSVVSDKYVERQRDWSARRDALPAFDRWIGDQVVAARDAALTGELDTFDQRFADECKARGVDVVRTEHKVKTDARRGVRQGDVLVGIEYHAKDDKTPGKAPRRRRRAASRLSSELTKEGLDRAMAAERQRRAAEAQQRAQEAAQRARVAGLRAVGLGAASTPEKPAQRGGPTFEELAAVASGTVHDRAAALASSMTLPPAAALGPRLQLPTEPPAAPRRATPSRTAQPVSPDPHAAARQARIEAMEAATQQRLAAAKAERAALVRQMAEEDEREAQQEPASTPTPALAPRPPEPIDVTRSAPAAAEDEAYVSPVRDEDVRSRDAPFRDRIADLDEHVVAAQRAGAGRYDPDLLEGMTVSKVKRYADALAPQTLETLGRRDAMLRRARLAFMEGETGTSDRIREKVRQGLIYNPGPAAPTRHVQDESAHDRQGDGPELGG